MSFGAAAPRRLRMKNKEKISYFVALLLIPAVVFGGAYLFRDKQYAWITLAVAVLSCIPFYLSFENGKADSIKIVLISVLTALSVVGRFIFAPLPGFKPVTAFVVITAMYFGGEAGFITGSLSAVISNFTFGQGPWTPFQMFIWGMIGLVAGLIAEPLKKSRVLLILYGALSGVLFSVLMDIWTVLWADGFFNFPRYAAAIVSSLPFMAIYAVSNVVFLLALERPIGKILDRVKTKYGIHL